MNQRMAYTAYCIADKIKLTRYQQEYPEDLLSKGSKEVYYQIRPGEYYFMLSYGVVVFAGMSPRKISDYLEQIEPFTIHPKGKPSSDTLQVHFELENTEELRITFDSLTLGHFDHSINRMIMMHLAQSVALDHYNMLSQATLSEVKSYTLDMELRGKVKLSQKKALQFIGKTLNTKNSIAENLYILDSPDVAWENEYLDRLHGTLARHFELVTRYREIDNTLKIVEDNLEIYLSYNHHRESSRLEWIIIILIVIEVLDTFATKLL